MSLSSWSIERLRISARAFSSSEKGRQRAVAAVLSRAGSTGTRQSQRAGEATCLTIRGTAGADFIRANAQASSVETADEAQPDVSEQTSGPPSEPIEEGERARMALSLLQSSTPASRNEVQVRRGRSPDAQDRASFTAFKALQVAEAAQQQAANIVPYCYLTHRCQSS